MEFVNLDPKVYRDLLSELNHNSIWKIVAMYLVKSNYLKKECVDRLERRGNAPNARVSPAELFLCELTAMTCNVATFCHLLKECELFDALYIILGEDELEITEQPYPTANKKPYEAAIDEIVTMTCKAEGLPPPRYQWFHGNVEICDQTSSTLTLLITSPDQEGEYQCRASQYNREDELLYEKFSNCAPLNIKPTPVEIEEHPTSAKAKVGGTLVLKCKAKGHPSPTYQWYKDNRELDGQTCNILQIDNFQRENKGEYFCRASNGSSEKFTNKVEVKMDYPRQKALAKIALVIANDNYQHAEELRLAKNDAALIGSLLTDIGFQVMSWRNLTLKEMRNVAEVFCGALRSGSYGLFYFVGHGFKLRDNYMMPVDVTETLSTKDAYCQEELLSNALKNKPALFVSILDMCLKIPEEQSNPTIYTEIPATCEYKCNENLILAYSTCSYNPSYEITDAENGIYASQLSKHITSNKPAYEIFTEVAHSVREVTTSKTSDQKPMLTTVTAEPYRYLTDAVICDSSGSPMGTDFAGWITFVPKTVELQFSIKQTRCKVSCQVTVQPLEPPYINIILLTTSGLEEWDVRFDNSSDDQARLCPMGRDCSIHNPQRTKKGSLMIHIGKRGTVHASKRFSYMKHVPEILRVL